MKNTHIYVFIYVHIIYMYNALMGIPILAARVPGHSCRAQHPKAWLLMIGSSRPCLAGLGRVLVMQSSPKKEYVLVTNIVQES